MCTGLFCGTQNPSADHLTFSVGLCVDNVRPHSQRYIQGALGTGCWRDFPRIVCWCVVVDDDDDDDDDDDVFFFFFFSFLLLCDGVGVEGGGWGWGVVC